MTPWHAGRLYCSSTDTLCASLEVGRLGISVCCCCRYSLSGLNYGGEAYPPVSLPPPLDIALLSLYYHLDNMAELPPSTSSEDGRPAHWKRSSRRSRKSGCHNIFTGVNLQQLHKLFTEAGDQDAEHRAKLVWRGMSAEKQRAEEAMEEEGGDMEEEVGLAQALVGLRVRARNKAGIRAEGNRDHRWLRASGYRRIDEPLPSDTVGDEEADVVPSSGAFRPAVEEDTPENPNPLKPSSPRLGMARREGARHSEHYLHRILH
nr:uncharacterized protein avpi1 isoform X2 [Gasterosteus aculeatus aculeatus]XP_040041836.1 uncharacterized protein avpi1 isoform X2 [Gasterosteus aculeatus aculeatus]